jgi:imidazolonepropionase-like amidohydrolase
MKKILASIILCFISAALLMAQSPGKTQVIAIKADRIIVGDGSEISNAVVLISKDRIIAAGKSSDVKIPGGATVIDLSGHTLMPGFIDAHTHLASIDNDGGDLAALKETPAHGAIYGTINARKTLDAGFTLSLIHI